MEAVLRPVFAGFLFIQDWRGWPDHRAHHIVGVIGLMRDPADRGRGAARISDADIAKIIEHERCLGYDEIKRPPARGSVLREDLEVGDIVEAEISGIPVPAVLESLSKSGQAIIRALIFGRDTPFTVEAETLHLISH